MCARKSLHCCLHVNWLKLHQLTIWSQNIYSNLLQLKKTWKYVFVCVWYQWSLLWSQLNDVFWSQLSSSFRKPRGRERWMSVCVCVHAWSQWSPRQRAGGPWGRKERQSSILSCHLLPGPLIPPSWEWLTASSAPMWTTSCVEAGLVGTWVSRAKVK